MKPTANALVRLSYDIGYLDDDDEFGMFGRSRVGHVRDLMFVAHGSIDWQPITTAPTDGTRFLVYSQGSKTYDFAEYDTRTHEFCKDGCGWDNATHWAAIAAGTRSAETRSKAPSEGCQTGGSEASASPKGVIDETE